VDCGQWSSIIPYLLPPSITIHGIIPVQFTCLTVFFHNLSSGDMQFRFMKGKGTTGTIFIVRQMQEKFRANGQKLYFGFVDFIGF